MPNQTLDLRPLTPADRAAWEHLWHGYQRYYRAHLPQNVTDKTWSRLTDPNERSVFGLAAWHDRKMVGFTHWIFLANTWTLSDDCYLKDLYVDPTVRGAGIGRALINAVYKAADAAGSERVWWLTQSFNADGRSLYDTLARCTSFVQYRR